MSSYDDLQTELKARPRTWLVTGVAGFIGSNLLETLLKLDQRVVGLDNFSTGHRYNLDEVQTLVSAEQWTRFRFIEGDIRNLADCQRACEGVDYVLHQAALGSVPRSIDDPLATHANNVDGFVNMLVAARDAKVKRVVYASSSSVYGDEPNLPKVEERIGNPLSPYAATKRMNEIYADVFARTYGMSLVGLRYFNVFGPRQDPNGAYAAVIPKWFASLLRDEPVYINGDGETSRDFCYIANTVQANLLAAAVEPQRERLKTEKLKAEIGQPALENQVSDVSISAFQRPSVSTDVSVSASQHFSISSAQIYNVALGHRTTLNELYAKIRDLVAAKKPAAAAKASIFRGERKGDVRHSLANTARITGDAGYAPTHTIGEGLAEAAEWYLRKS